MDIVTGAPATVTWQRREHRHQIPRERIDQIFGGFLANLTVAGWNRYPNASSFALNARRGDAACAEPGSARCRGWLYWIDAGAEDRHHTRFRSYAAVEIVHEKDLRLIDSTGDIVASVTALDAWSSEHARATRERLSLARADVSSTPSRVGAWANFVADYRPKPESAKL